MTPQEDGISADITFDLALLLSMFDSWSMDHGFGGVDKKERLSITETLLRQRGFQTVESVINAVTLGIISLNPEYDLSLPRTWRKLSGFDGYVESFCESIELHEKHYKKNAISKKSSNPTTPESLIDRVARTAVIRPVVDDQDSKFIIQILLSAEEFAGFVNKKLVERFIELCDRRISSGFFDDPSRVMLVFHGVRAEFNQHCERLVFCRNGTNLFGWNVSN